jgi:hypothetical protein
MNDSGSGAGKVWTPRCGSPLLAKRALQLASEQAHALGHREVRPEHPLLGVLEDARQPRLRVSVVWVKRWTLDTQEEIDGAGMVDPRVTHRSAGAWLRPAIAAWAAATEG